MSVFGPAALRRLVSRRRQTRLGLLTGAMTEEAGRVAGGRSLGGYWWGHDTIEDQAARRKAEEDKGAIVWTDPERNLEEKKDFVWVPARIEGEAALTTQVSVFHNMVNTADWYNMTTKPFYWWAFLFDPVHFREETRRRLHRNLVIQQMFIRSRLTALGPDLAAAVFLCHRNCRVRFAGEEKWTELEPNGKLNIPDVYVKGWYVEAIDCAGSSLVYEGLQNLKSLRYLKHLDISYSQYIDVWCMDRITGEYANTLEHLDISGCRKLDWNGIEVLWRLKNLKTLVLNDMEHVKDLPLLCLMLLDVLPKLKIVGVEYIDKDLLIGTEHEHLLLDETGFLSLEPGDLAEASVKN